MLVAAEGQAADEDGEEAVAAGRLGDAVEHERGRDRVVAVERRGEQLAVAQPVHAPGRRPAHGGADRRAGRAGVERGRPANHSSIQPVPPSSATKMPIRTSGAARPSLPPASAVSAKFGSCSASSPGRADADVARQHGIGRGEHRAQQQRGAEREAHDLGRRTARRRAIVSGIASASSRVTEPHSRQRSGRSSFSPDENSAKISATSATCSITSASLERVEPLDVEQLDREGRDRPEPEVDQRRRERPLVLVRHRPDGREDGEADEQQADRERVGEREAGVRGERRSLVGGGTDGPVGVRRRRVVGLRGRGAVRQVRHRRARDPGPRAGSGRPGRSARSGSAGWRGSRARRRS